MWVTQKWAAHLLDLFLNHILQIPLGHQDFVNILLVFGNISALFTYEIYKLNQYRGHYTMYKRNDNRASVIKNETVRHKI